MSNVCTRVSMSNLVLAVTPWLFMACILASGVVWANTGAVDDAQDSLETGTPLDGLSHQNTRVFQRASDVTVYRIEREPIADDGTSVVEGAGATQPGGKAPESEHEVVLPGTVTLSKLRPSPKQVRRLRRLLTSPSTYVPPGQTRRKRCRFEPGVVVRLRHGGAHMDLVLCFVCDQQDIPGVGIVDIDPGRPGLVRLIKRFFPKDRAILGLKSKREDWGWWRRGAP